MKMIFPIGLFVFLAAAYFFVVAPSLTALSARVDARQAEIAAAMAAFPQR